MYVPPHCGSPRRGGGGLRWLPRAALTPPPCHPPHGPDGSAACECARGHDHDATSVWLGDRVRCDATDRGPSVDDIKKEALRAIPGDDEEELSLTDSEAEEGG